MFRELFTDTDRPREQEHKTAGLPLEESALLNWVTSDSKTLEERDEKIDLIATIIQQKRDYLAKNLNFKKRCIEDRVKIETLVQAAGNIVEPYRKAGKDKLTKVGDVRYVIWLAEDIGLKLRPDLQHEANPLQAEIDGLKTTLTKIELDAARSKRDIEPKKIILTSAQLAEMNTNISHILTFVQGESKKYPVYAKETMPDMQRERIALQPVLDFLEMHKTKIDLGAARRPIGREDVSLDKTRESSESMSPEFADFLTKLNKPQRDFFMSMIKSKTRACFDNLLRELERGLPENGTSEETPEPTASLRLEIKNLFDEYSASVAEGKRLLNLAQKVNDPRNAIAIQKMARDLASLETQRDNLFEKMAMITKDDAGKEYEERIVKLKEQADEFSTLIKKTEVYNAFLREAPAEIIRLTPEDADMQSEQFWKMRTIEDRKVSAEEFLILNKDRLYAEKVIEKSGLAPLGNQQYCEIIRFLIDNPDISKSERESKVKQYISSKFTIAPNSKNGLNLLNRLRAVGIFDKEKICYADLEVTVVDEIDGLYLIESAAKDGKLKKAFRLGRGKAKIDNMPEYYANIIGAIISLGSCTAVDSPSIRRTLIGSAIINGHDLADMNIDDEYKSLYLLAKLKELKLIESKGINEIEDDDNLTLNCNGLRNTIKDSLIKARNKYFEFKNAESEFSGLSSIFQADQKAVSKKEVRDAKKKALRLKKDTLKMQEEVLNDLIKIAKSKPKKSAAILQKRKDEIDEFLWQNLGIRKTNPEHELVYDYLEKNDLLGETLDISYEDLKARILKEEQKYYCEKNKEKKVDHIPSYKANLIDAIISVCKHQGNIISAPALEKAMCHENYDNPGGYKMLAVAKELARLGILSPMDPPSQANVICLPGWENLPANIRSILQEANTLFELFKDGKGGITQKSILEIQDKALEAIANGFTRQNNPNKIDPYAVEGKLEKQKEIPRTTKSGIGPIEDIIDHLAHFENRNAKNILFTYFEDKQRQLTADQMYELLNQLAGLGIISSPDMDARITIDENVSVRTYASGLGKHVSWMNSNIELIKTKNNISSPETFTTRAKFIMSYIKKIERELEDNMPNQNNAVEVKRFRFVEEEVKKFKELLMDQDVGIIWDEKYQKLMSGLVSYGNNPPYFSEALKQELAGELGLLNNEVDAMFEKLRTAQILTTSNLATQVPARMDPSVNKITLDKDALDRLIANQRFFSRTFGVFSSIKPSYRRSRETSAHWQNTLDDLKAQLKSSNERDRGAQYIPIANQFLEVAYDELLRGKAKSGVPETNAYEMRIETEVDLLTRTKLFVPVWPSASSHDRFWNRGKQTWELLNHHGEKFHIYFDKALFENENIYKLIKKAIYKLGKENEDSHNRYKAYELTKEGILKPIHAEKDDDSKKKSPIAEAFDAVTSIKPNKKKLMGASEFDRLNNAIQSLIGKSIAFLDSDPGQIETAGYGPKITSIVQNMLTETTTLSSIAQKALENIGADDMSKDILTEIETFKDRLGRMESMKRLIERLIEKCNMDLTQTDGLQGQIFSAKEKIAQDEETPEVQALMLYKHAAPLNQADSAEASRLMAEITSHEPPKIKNASVIFSLVGN
ncbi:MAG: hypothetical protein NTZ80_00245 [Patescibacteria group bacterium]|nr:hypothetical protein [Patescibacteria group bacterium]